MTLAFISALAGCGGGGSDPVSSDQISIAGTAVDGTGKALASAEIGIIVKDTVFKAQSDSSGVFDLRVNASLVAGINYVSAYVSKTGYRPAALVYRNLVGGTGYNGNSTLPVLAANESVPTDAQLVYHLGNDVFGGTQNSQFQRSSQGGIVSLALADFDAKLAAGYTTATVSFLHKGVQVTDGCVDTVGLYQTSAGAVNLSSTATIRASNADGSYTAESYSLSLAGFVPGRTNSVSFVSRASCTTAGDVYDDYEVTNVFVSFK